MNKDTDGGLQPGRDPDDIDAAQAALNQDARRRRGPRRNPPKGAAAARQQPQKPARSAGEPAVSASSTAPAGIRWGSEKSWDASSPNAAGARRWPSDP